MNQNQIASDPNGFIKQVLNANDLMQCAECGVYSGIYVTVKELHFCSSDCKELYFMGREDSEGADKFDDQRDLEIEDSFDEELDSFNPDRY